MVFFLSPGPREPLGLLPACRLGAWGGVSVPLHWGALGTGGRHAGRAPGGGAAADQRAVCFSVSPSPVKQVRAGS
jgi:hypothetical protein